MQGFVNTHQKHETKDRMKPNLFVLCAEKRFLLSEKVGQSYRCQRPRKIFVQFFFAENFVANLAEILEILEMESLSKSQVNRTCHLVRDGNYNGDQRGKKTGQTRAK